MRTTVIFDLNGDAITNADVNINLDGDVQPMVFSNGAYRTTFALGKPSGVFGYTIDAKFSDIEQSASGTLVFTVDFREGLSVTNINNTTIQVDFNQVSVSHSSYNKETQTSFAYRTENITDLDTIDVAYEARGGKAFTFDVDPIRNFIIFTRDDNSTEFQLNDSLTVLLINLFSSLIPNAKASTIKKFKS